MSIAGGKCLCVSGNVLPCLNYFYIEIFSPNNVFETLIYIYIYRASVPSCPSGRRRRRPRRRRPSSVRPSHRSSNYYLHDVLRHKEKMESTATACFALVVSQNIANTTSKKITPVRYRLLHVFPQTSVALRVLAALED